MRKILLSVVAVCMLIFAGIAFAGELPDSGYIEVRGIAEPDQSYSSGVRAAELIAYRKAAEEIDQLQLDSDTTVEQGKTLNDTIRARLSTVLRRVKVLDEGKQADGYYFAVVRVPLFGSNSVASAVFQPNATVEPFPQPKFPQPVSASSGSGYTGVIVDCRGLGLETAMSPVIKNDANQPIYGYKNLDYDVVVQQGMAAYADSPTENVSRAGTNPLVVKAVKVEGFGSPCNPVVSTSDADKILSANKSSHFLEKCAVVFVR